MSTSETRLVRYIPGHGPVALEDVIEQQAIPWCTTHDIQAFTDQSNVCWLDEELEDLNPHPCTISTGGLDHKWWMDVSEDLEEEE